MHVDNLFYLVTRDEDSENGEKFKVFRGYSRLDVRRPEGIYKNIATSGTVQRLSLSLLLLLCTEVVIRRTILAICFLFWMG